MAPPAAIVPEIDRLLLVFHIFTAMLVASESRRAMLEHLPEDIRRGLEEARRRDRRRNSRLCLHVDGEVLPLLRMWDGGFALDAECAPGLRGLVDIHDGPRHVAQCLIVASALEGDVMTYEFKRATTVANGPARDFGEEGELPSGYLPAPV